MSRASDRAYSGIRSMILSGELPAGSQIGEEALAERCGVSRTPVRDALRRLESELLVKRNEAQRSFVADWSLDDIADGFELRAMLEGHAARRAAERIDDETLQRLRRCNIEILAAIQTNPPDVTGFLDGNREFHAVILEAAKSPRLAAMLGALIEQPVVWRTAQQYGREALRRSHGEHEELLAAFARHDGDWAQSVMTSHIRRAFHAYADAHQGLAAIDAGSGS
ncbi:GntR family transcriptional regulator [Novosphingobium kunmingense]|uniref:GntR family transcriptional regulator n=1 Tax=Novosphingobium kunmingense TaxID=1211806 RepID=A0A2N0H3E2_9SPHN|nr:GntR family transcriptional regulator [Novosphingobium kunmingense]PKB13466.1 GntR family transcriptional regulator [Novosphingobium kunmingense]